MTELKTKMDYLDTKVPEIERKLQKVETSTKITEAVKEATKNQRNMILSVMAIIFGGATAIAAVIKLF